MSTMTPQQVAALLQTVLEAGGLDVLLAEHRAEQAIVDARRLATPQTVAFLLDCHPDTARKRMTRGLFGPVVRGIDKHPRVPLAAVLRWIEDQRTEDPRNGRRHHTRAANAERDRGTADGSVAAAPLGAAAPARAVAVARGRQRGVRHGLAAAAQSR
jgi:hypothetical protein